MSRNRFRTAAIGLLLIGAAAAACAPQPTTPASEVVCGARAQLETALDAFRAIDPATAEAGEYQFAWIAVRQAALGLRDYAYEMADENATALNDAIDDLDRAINDLPEDASISDAVAALQPQIDAVEAALAAVDGDLDCP